MNFSVLGNGFVGNALFEGMKHKFNISIYDIDPMKCNNTFVEVVENRIIFICLPSPTNLFGEIDTSIIESSIRNIDDEKLFVIKSTVTPNSMQRLVNLFPNQRFVVNPEFLTERTAVKDFKNPSRIILGGNLEDVQIIEELYREVFPETKIIKTDHKTACFIKYFSNCFYATKVSLMNEFKQIADANEINWVTAVDGLLSSGWVNPMHTMVPGPDGDCGFGGKCFPKDINALISEAKELGIEPKMLEAAWEKNLEVRNDKNWLKIKGAMER